MNNYCENCGNKLDKEADFCLNCGKRVIKRLTPRKGIYASIETISFVSMILGIIAFLLILLLGYNLNEIKMELINEDIILKLICSNIYTMFSLIPAILSLLISLYSLKKEKTKYGIIGLIISLVTIILSIEVIIFIIK